VEKLLLTIAEAAQVIGLGRSKVYELVASGAIESVRIGRSRRVPLDAVEAYVAELRADVRSSAT
jgi:excisionase family DNA binding protein